MQTILGSGGAIGVELAKVLTEYTDKIRLVSRNPKKVNDGDELFTADLLHKDETNKAVEGSEIVYVTAGFQYNIKVWRESWPVFIDNVIEACSRHQAKLVFFDNIYMYDPDTVSFMTEKNPYNPKSKKGKVRKIAAEKLEQAWTSKKIKALIARSADFYGPSIKNNSMLTELILNNLANGKAAMWMGGKHFKHSFTYTPDAARATAILGNTEKAYNQVWHLPTDSNPLTAAQFVEISANELDAKPKIQISPKFLFRILGLFIPIMKELVEMYYQYDRDYIFDSSKFVEQFSFTPTSYQKGLKTVIKNDYK